MNLIELARGAPLVVTDQPTPAAEDWQARDIARGKGMLPTGPSIERYARATVKQIVLHFEGMEYKQVIERLRRVLAKERLRTHREAFLRMLKLWEETHDHAASE